MRRGNDDIRKDTGVVDEKVDAVRLESQHARSIALGTAYATMNALSGKKDMVNKWMLDIEKCVEPGDKHSAAVKSRS